MSGDWSLRSVGYATDLVLMYRQGSEIVERDGYVVLRTPRNPTYHWGNCLVLRGAPEPGSLAHWLAVFASEHPAAAHVAIGIDDPTADLDAAEAAALGIDVEHDVALTTGSMTLGVAPAGYSLAPVGPDDEAAWVALVELEMTDGFVGDPASHRRFLERRYAGHRQAAQAGEGSWWAATTADGAPVATLGVFDAGAGRARYQQVMTHPAHRRRGLAEALVRAAGQAALAHLGASSLVIVADPDGPAIGVYRRVGFVQRHRQTALYRSGA